MNEAPGQPVSLPEEFTIAELSEWSQCPRRAWLNRLGALPAKRPKKRLATIATNAAKNAINLSESSHDLISGTDQYIELARRRFDFQSSKEIQTEPQAKRYARNARDRFMEFIRGREKDLACEAEFGVEVRKSFQIEDYRDPILVKANMDAVLSPQSPSEPVPVGGTAVGYVLAPWPNHGRANRYSLLGEFNDNTRHIYNVYFHPLSLAVSCMRAEPYPDLYLATDYALATAMKWIEWSGDEAALQQLARETIVPAAPNERMCQGCRFYGGRWCKEIDHIDLN